MRFFTLTGIVVLFVLFFSSCEKNTNTNPVPNITFKSFTAASRDSATLQVNFTDGDGDIGYPAQDASAPYNFFVQYYFSYDTIAPSIAQFPTDSIFRPYLVNNNVADTLTFKYHIPDITPAGKDKSLTGIIEVAMTGTPPAGWYVNYCLNSPSQNYFVYKVWLIDRAGNKSNVLTTPIEQGL